MHTTETNAAIKITVITVCYNAAATIEKCILSVINQQYAPIEYIIVDGNSTDGTIEMVHKYINKIDVFVSEPDHGIYHAMNKGIAMATGHYIALLNADDEFAHPLVLNHISAVLAHTKARILYADLVYVKQDNIVRYWKSGFYNSTKFYWGWMPPHPTLVVHSSVYKQYGSFDTRLKTAADYEFMLRVLYKNKVEAAYLPEITVRMSVGGVSNRSIKNRLKANAEDRLAWQLNHLKMPFWLPVLKPIRKIFQYMLKPYKDNST